MVTDKIKKIAELKAQAAKLEASVEAERQAELAALPAKFGYDSLASFIKALKASGGSKRGRAAGAKSRRKRTPITPALKEKVKAAVAAGKSGAEIVKSLGLSMASVQNIKREFGLTKPRKG